MNRESSRSHAVFTLVIEATEEIKEEGLTRCRVARYALHFYALLEQHLALA
jgi:hypothetical protein